MNLVEIEKSRGIWEMEAEEIGRPVMAEENLAESLILFFFQ